MGATITIRRRVEWIDTDAAGIWHYSTAIRLAEAAELELHRNLGIQDLTFGVTPRAHVEFDFVRSVRFDDLLDVTVEVTTVGRTSVTYELSLTGPDGSVATGRVVAVFVDPDSGRPRPWPADVRQLLAGP